MAIAEQAVRHWLAAGDVEPAADLVAASCDELLGLGQTETAKRLLDLFSDKQILSHAPLTLVAGWMYGVGNPHYLTQRARENIVRAACSTLMDDTPSFDDRASLRSSQAQLRAFLAPDGIGRMLADAELSLELESGNPAGDGYMEACKLRGIALYLSGRPDRAIGPLKAEEDMRDPPTAAGAAAEVLAFQSLIAADQGRWDDAEELAEEAWRLGDPTGTDWEYSLVELLARARVLARRRDAGLADHLQRVTRFLDEMPNLFEREVILGSVVLGEIALGRDDLLAAESWSARAHAVLRRYPDAGMLGPRAERLRLALQERRFGAAVTAAEQRVLDLLPTAALGQRYRRAVVHLAQHDEEPHALAVRQARRAFADGSRRAGARARSAEVRPLKRQSGPGRASWRRGITARRVLRPPPGPEPESHHRCDASSQQRPYAGQATDSPCGHEAPCRSGSHEGEAR